MRKLSLSAVVFGLASLSLCASAQTQPRGAATAQQPYNFGANAPKYGIAVVDISFLFQQYPKYTQAMEGLKAELAAAEKSLTTTRDAILNREKQRDTYKPGSDQYKALDEQIAREKADFSIKASTLRRDIQEKESKVLFSTYQDISAAISSYARSNNIGLVLRFVGDQVDPEQQKDIMRAVTQPIVFQNNIDITPHVRDLLLKGQQQAARPQGRR